MRNGPRSDLTMSVLDAPLPFPPSRRLPRLPLAIVGVQQRLQSAEPLDIGDGSGGAPPPERPLRLAVQDAALSRLKQGFESPRGRQFSTAKPANPLNS